MINLFEHMSHSTLEETTQNRVEAAARLAKLADAVEAALVRIHSQSTLPWTGQDSYLILLDRYRQLINLISVADPRVIQDALARCQSELADTERRCDLLLEHCQRKNWPEALEQAYWQQSLRQLRLEDKLMILQHGEE